MKWTVTPYSLQDIPAIALFFKRHYSGMGSYGGSDLFFWKIVSNPLGPGIINLVKDGERIVSTTSVTPKRLFLEGQAVAAAEIGDTYTDPAYQRQGMFALLINQSTQGALAHGVKFVYGTPNQQSLPGYEAKANYLRIPNLNLESLSFPINVKPLVQRRAHWLIATYSGAASSTLAFLAVTAQRVTTRAVSVEELTEIPADWDEFWQTCLTGYDFLIARDKSAMEWRYLRHPYKYKFLVVRSEGRIQGYATYRIVQGDDYSVMTVADYMFRPGAEDALRSLLVHIAEHALRAGVAAVNAWCPAANPHRRVFRRFGFVTRGHVPVIAFQNDLAAQLGGRALRWHFTTADSDNV